MGAHLEAPSYEVPPNPSCVKGQGSAKAPLSCGRKSPQGLCSLKEGFRMSEEEVPVLGVIKCGVMYDIAR